MNSHSVLRVVLIFFILALVHLFAEDDPPLIQPKQSILQEKQKGIDAGAEANRFDWLSPLNLSIGHTQQNSPVSPGFQGMNQASASISQDIFRSGGIYYAIRYANDQFNYDSLAWEKEYRGYYREIFLCVLQIRKYRLEYEQSSFLVKNQEIAVFLKRYQYEAGEIDITQLNDAIMQKNSEQTNRLVFKQSLEQEKEELYKYTERKEDQISVPEFALIDEKTYQKNNYEIALAKQQSSVAYDNYRTTLSSYLPSVNLNAQASHNEYVSNASSVSLEGNTYSVGVALNIPLNYNAFSNVEQKKAQMLEQKATAEDTKREEMIEYKKVLLLIERYAEVNKVLEENIEIYTSLLDITEKAFKTGYKTGYDLQTLQNSIKAAELEIQINQINIQIEWIKLHFAIRTKKG